MEQAGHDDFFGLAIVQCAHRARNQVAFGDPRNPVREEIDQRGCCGHFGQCGIVAHLILELEEVHH